MVSQVFDLEKVETIIFDVGGTLFREDREYVSGIGSVQNSFDFFRFLSWELIKKHGWDAHNAARWIRKKYKEAIEGGSLRECLDEINDQIKEEYLWCFQKHLNDDILCACEYGLKDYSFFHEEMINFIDFKKLLIPDLRLYALIAGLKEQGFSLGILSSESFPVVQNIFEALGLPLSWFFMDTEGKYPIFCAENICKKDFLSKNYKRLKKSCLCPNESSKTILYVGDHLERDVKAPLNEGLQALHILNQRSQNKMCQIRIGHCIFEYPTLQNIYEMENLFFHSRERVFSN